jgi:TonB family protein
VQRHRSLFGRALGASLVLHLLLLFVIVPSARKVWPLSLSGAPIFDIKKPADEAERPLEFEIVDQPESGQETPATRVPQRPDEFELVDLANNREEAPASDRAPLSDLDRRAHGGVGAPGATSPASVGNTTQLVQAVGGDRLGSGAPSEQAAQPERERRQQAGGAAAPEPAPPEPAGDSAQPSEDEPQGGGGTTQQLRPPARQVPPPPAEPRAPADGATDQEPTVPSDGAGQDDESQPPAQEPRLTLPPNDSWALPPGEGGLPENPDRRGGQVDEGGLSFDTQWYEWGPYAAKMLRAIRRNWQIPEIARLGVSGVVRIRFFIERSGEVTGLVITDESGRPPMDFAARDAIVDSSPFDPLPGDLIGVDREGVTITFYYNARPPGR